MQPWERICQVTGETRMDSTESSSLDLRKLPAFRQNTAEEQRFIDSMKLRTLRYKANKLLIAEKSQSLQLYTLLEGWVIRHKLLSDGRRQILNVLLPGDVIGLQHNFLQEATSNVESLTDVTLCELDKHKLMPMFHNHPELAYSLAWMCAREEQIVDDNLLNVGARSAIEKIAMLILHIYKRYRSIYPNAGKNIPFPLNQQDIADALGLSLVHTNKTLKKLEKLGMHRISEGRLTIHNERALESLADYMNVPLKPRSLLY